MVQACRTLAALAFAVVVARSSVTVSWNSHPSPAGVPGQTAPRVRTALVISVRGTHVLLRLNDGTTRAFIATPQQAHELERLVGTAIRFQSR